MSREADPILNGLVKQLVPLREFAELVIGRNKLMNPLICLDMLEQQAHKALLKSKEPMPCPHCGWTSDGSSPLHDNDCPLVQPQTNDPSLQLSPIPKQILDYVNTHPEVMSTLYDVGLLPEQTMKDPHNWLRTVLIVKLFERIHKLEETK